MALTNTTLATAAGSNDMSIKVTSATGFAAGNIIRVDNEIMAQTGAASGTSIPVRRGIEGTSAIAHGILADVVTGLPGDYPNPPPAQVTFVPVDAARVTLGVDTTLSSTDFVQDTTFVLTKAGVCAITLGAPSKAQNGVRIGFRSNTANAHTVTYTAGFYGDTTSSDVATFAAKVGASCTFEANGGAWGVLTLANVTLA